MIFNSEIIFNGSSGQVAAVDKNSSLFAGLPAEFINNCFLASKTARLFLVSAAKFDIAGERAYIDQPKTVICSQAMGWVQQEAKQERNNGQRS